MTFMKDPASTDHLEDLRFALAVMEERSHLGLDLETATTVRSAFLHLIAVREAALRRKPQSAAPASIEEQYYA
jgi:hypothetical protein